jgi:flavin reductase (DIM6/NTAB) family NADH-FMN oxidoreductase RutF
MLLSSGDAAAFRKTLGRFATGITIVTTIDAAGAPQGITVNSFTSVSLTPPLVLFCIGKSSQSLEPFLACKSFNINILAADQEPLSNRFASKMENRFDGTGWHPGANGAPLLPGTLAALECNKFQTVEAGDHYILIGEVTASGAREGEPLLYFASKYRQLQAAE